MSTRILEMLYENLTTAHFRAGQVNLGLASENLPESKRVEHLGMARSEFQRGLEITVDMRNRKIVNPTPLDGSPLSPEDRLFHQKRSLAQIAICDAKDHLF